ncbi:MAG: hypothetical protein U5L96_19320 [Owenweeksia sp.]|nr:hypothetical protein [Owenweeksia sp.]
MPSSIGALAAGVLVYVKATYAPAECPAWEVLMPSSAGSLVAFSFLLIRYTVEHVVYNEVKIIYRNIHDLKVGKWPVGRR